MLHCGARSAKLQGARSATADLAPCNSSPAASVSYIAASSRSSDDIVPSTSAIRSFVSIDVICPVVKRVTSSQPTHRKRAAEQSEIVTNSPYKRKLIEKKALKDSKTAVQKKSPNNDSRDKNVKGKGKGKASKSLKTNVVSVNEKDDAECVYCLERFTASKREHWIMCNQCKKWSHEKCTDYSGVGGFICDFCR